MREARIFRSENYQHPEDLRMLHELDRMRHLQSMASDFLREVNEPVISGALTANGIKVSKIQFPEVYSCAEDIAAIFGVPTPQVFIINDPIPNAFIHGIGGLTFVGVAHSLIEQLDPCGLRFIFGHEIGHIQCRHVLYTTMMQWLLGNTQRVPRGDVEQLLLTMFSWMRMAELSADRAGLLACGNSRSAFICLLTMTVGSRDLAEQVDIHEYVADQTCSLSFNPFALRRQNTQSHPFMPFRICELDKFANSSVFEQFMDQVSPIMIDLK